MRKNEDVEIEPIKSVASRIPDTRVIRSNGKKDRDEF
jgi:hypothetical protein